MPVAAGGRAPWLSAPRYADCPTGTRGTVRGHFRLPGDISIVSTFLPRGLLRVLMWGGVDCFFFSYLSLFPVLLLLLSTGEV